MRLSQLLQLSATIAAAATLAALLASGNYFAGEYRLTVLTIGLGALAALVSASLSATLVRAPTTLSISLLGFPEAGKTVFLTTLFDRLGRLNTSNLRFAPYGQETVERVTANLNLLSHGKWLPRTQQGEIFFFRATATLGASLFRRRFKIEIADMAGERLREFDSTSDLWLHKGEYFRHVTQSDAIVLGVDAHKILLGDRFENASEENALVAAVQMLCEAKGATASIRMSAPVALVFFKMDLVRDVSPFDLLSRVRRLTDICEARCRHFKVFFVSSVGHSGEGGGPPSELRPERIEEPVLWILDRNR